MSIADLDAGRGATEPDAAPELVALTERLLSQGAPEPCARTALEWLAEHAGVARALCAMVDPEAGRLVALADRGLHPGASDGWAIELTERTHPLVVALESREPVTFEEPGEGGRRPPATPLGEGPLVAVSLAGTPGSDPEGFGLLLVSGAEGALPDVALLAPAARRLGVCLAALGYSRARSAETRLKREGAWLRGIMEAVTDPILLTDPEGRILLANTRAEHLLTSDEEAGLGRRRAVALNNMLFSASLFTNAERGEPARRELLLVDPLDGQDLVFELLTTPFTLEAGSVGMVSILRDVTDLSRATVEIEENYRRLRTAEAETRAERDRLGVVLSSVLDPILVTDPGGNIVLMNPPAERLFTIPRDAPNRDAERRVRANDAVFTSFASDIYAGRSLRWKKQLTLSDPETGEQIPMEAVSAKTHTKPGQDTAVVTVLHDQSEAVEKARLYEQVKRHSEELEERVREATRELADQNEVLRRQALQLEQASAMKSQFLANVSHDLRTPLHAIVGYTSILLEGMGGEPTPAQREKLERVDSNANHLLAIINDLLDLTRIESGKMPVRVEEFRVHELFDEVRREVESLIEARELDVAFTAPDSLPALASDRQKVKQIVVNLLSNALKFTPEGEVRIEARHEPEGEGVEISVADTGVGISEVNQSKIFEAFGQSESVASGQTGTGLGLSICRRLARILGGDITLESEVGVGSTFTLVLPQRVEEP